MKMLAEVFQSWARKRHFHSIEGRIYTPIRKVFPFRDVPAALTYLTSDDLMGRVIVEISWPAREINSSSDTGSLTRG